MKLWQLVGTIGLAFNTLAALAEEAKVQPAITELPTEERAFVDAVGKLDKAKIVELLGEPAKAEDVKLKDSGRIVASIWHYHFINTSAADGEYYQTTELDFIGDKVSVVVFLNHDGTEKTVPGQTYEVPAMPPNM